MTRPGHLPTLVACFLHFTLCFMLWVLLGALGAYIFDAAGIGPGLKGLVVGVPILTGSLLRIPLGVLSDRAGGRRVGIGLLLFLVCPLTLGWLGAPDLLTLVVVGLMLGAAGASFAVVLPLASRWYPDERQGLVMGIAAAGNSGTVLANLFAPRLANLAGWQGVFGLALLPLVAVLLVFWSVAKDAPGSVVARPWGQCVAVVKQPDTWRLCFFYSITFGGYVGLSSFLPLFLRDQFGVAPVTAGLLTAVAALAGSLARPVGGYLADRIGGVPLLQLLLMGIGLSYLAFAMLPSIGVMAPLLVVAMVCLGLGNGAVFQVVSQRCGGRIGSVTGVVGAVGGLGGFLLPAVLGAAKQGAGSFTPGFLILCVVAGTAWVSLCVLVRSPGGAWRIAPVAAVSEEL